MSYKFTLRDALLEAGARDYRDEPANKSWVPSDKLRKDMDKLIKKRGKCVSGTVIKAVAVAASVLLVSGVILTLKPVREAFSGTGDKTDTAPVTAPSTDGTAYFVPAAQTTAAGERETEFETSVAPPDAPPVTPDQTGVYLLLLGTEKDDEASGFLYAPEREAEVCGYCISVLTGSGASKELKNGAAHFLHDLKGFVSPLFAILPYDEELMDMSGYGGETPYLSWFENYMDKLKEEAKNVTETDASDVCYQYNALSASGFSGWSAVSTYEQQAKKALTGFFGLFNNVFAGIPVTGTVSTPVGEPYPQELAEKITKLWGDEKRTFYKSSLTLSDFRSLYERYVMNTHEEIFIDDTKYFIICGDTIYTTPCTEKDSDAHVYGSVSIKRVNVPSSESRLLFGTAEAVYDGRTKNLSFELNDTRASSNRYRFTADRMIRFVIGLRDEKIIETAVSDTAKNTKESSLTDTCIFELRDMTVDYVLRNYFNETDEGRRAAMGMLYYQILWMERIREYNVFKDLMDRQTSNELNRYGDVLIHTISNSDQKKIFTVWLDRFIMKLEPFAAKRYRNDVKEFFPSAYKLLEKVGFDGYLPGDGGTAARARDTLIEIEQLLNALKYGIGIYDDSSILYGNKEAGNLEYPDELKKLLGDETPFFEGIYTQAEGFKTADEWKAHYKKIMNGALVDEFIKPTKGFMIVDGTVYTGFIGVECVYSLDVLNAREIERKGDVAVLELEIRIPNGMGTMGRLVTVEVTEDERGVFAQGGTLFDIFFKDGATKGKAARAVYEALRIQEILLDGNINFSPSRDGDEIIKIDDRDELRDFLNKNFISGKTEVPDDMFPLYLNVDWQYGFTWEGWIGAVFPDKNVYYNRLVTENENVAFIDQMVAISGNNVRVTNTPVIGSADVLTLTDVYNAMNVISEEDGKITVSLDFIRREGGESKNVTYTFETEDRGIRSDCLTITGGTFLSDVINGN